MATEIGKRYTCTTCGSQIIVTKVGGGTITCCGQEMIKKS